MRKVAVILALAATVLSFAPARALSGVVYIYDFHFTPGAVTRGKAVKFTNLEAGGGYYGIPHQPAYPVGCTTSCVWSSPPLRVGSISASVKITLPPGTYTYYCKIHHYMRGRLVVSKV